MSDLDLETQEKPKSKSNTKGSFFNPMLFCAMHQSGGMLLSYAVLQQQPERRKIILENQAATAFYTAMCKCADVAGKTVLLMLVSLEQSNGTEHFLVSLPDVEY